MNIQSSIRNLEVLFQASSLEGCHIMEEELKRTPSLEQPFWRHVTIIKELFAQVPIISCLPFARKLHVKQEEMRKILHESQVNIFLSGEDFADCLNSKESSISSNK